MRVDPPCGPSGSGLRISDDESHSRRSDSGRLRPRNHRGRPLCRSRETREREAETGVSHPGMGVSTTCCSMFREGIPMKYRAFQESTRRFPIRILCRTFVVWPTSYHIWAGRSEGDRCGRRENTSHFIARTGPQLYLGLGWVPCSCPRRPDDHVTTLRPD